MGLTGFSDSSRESKAHRASNYVRVILLYATVVLIWGSTWSAIPYQLGVVAAEVSVGYRYGLASLLLYSFALLSKRQIRIPADAWPFVLLMGTFLFCLNYILVYYASAYITSGLVAVLFSSIVLFNALFERFFFKASMDRRALVAGALGLTGIAMIFWPEIDVLSYEDKTIAGIVIMLVATVIASLGNMIATVNTRRTLPVIAMNAHAMAWAAALALGLSAALGRDFNFSFEPGYIISLGFLAVFGSAIAFGCYLALIRLIGPARAAYSSVLFPVVALGISTVVEDYQWTPVAAVGIILTLAGNWLILSSRAINNK